MAESGASVLLPGDRESLQMDTMCLEASPWPCRYRGELLLLPRALGCTEACPSGELTYSSFKNHV